MLCNFVLLLIEHNGYELSPSTQQNIYRTRAIITRGLYLFYLIFHCGLYCRAVYIAERLVFSWIFFHATKTAQKKDRIGKLSAKKELLLLLLLYLLTWIEKEKLFFVVYIGTTIYGECSRLLIMSKLVG